MDRWGGAGRLLASTGRNHITTAWWWNIFHIFTQHGRRVQRGASLEKARAGTGYRVARDDNQSDVGPRPER